MWKEVSLSIEMLCECQLGEKYRFNDEWAGKYNGKSVSTGKGLRFDYFVNPTDEYRVTTVTRTGDPTVKKLDVNSTSGDHETLAQMIDCHKVEQEFVRGEPVIV